MWCLNGNSVAGGVCGWTAGWRYVVYGAVWLGGLDGVREGWGSFSWVESRDVETETAIKGP